MDEGSPLAKMIWDEPTSSHSSALAGPPSLKTGLKEEKKIKYFPSNLVHPQEPLVTVPTLV